MMPRYVLKKSDSTDKISEIVSLFCSNKRRLQKKASSSHKTRALYNVLEFFGMILLNIVMQGHIYNRLNNLENQKPFSKLEITTIHGIK